MPKNIASTKIQLSSKYSTREKTAIAQEIIDYIRERSSRGEGPNGKWKGSYSSSYVKSLDFKIAGKSKSDINQRLSGDMLTDIEILKIKSDEVTIGYDFSSPNWGKAKGNILGTYGNKNPIQGKDRPFLDLKASEIREILSRYPLNDKEQRTKSTLEILESIKAAKDLIDE